MVEYSRAVVHRTFVDTHSKIRRAFNTIRFIAHDGVRELLDLIGKNNLRRRFAHERCERGIVCVRRPHQGRVNGLVERLGGHFADHREGRWLTARGGPLQIY